MPRISVVIPTYNRAEYLPQAIDSVLEQTVSDVEIIVVDDGSTDDTRDRVQAYGDRVSYVHTTNGGSAHARNVGMRAARGQYLTFLDSDDLYYPYTLELQSRVLDRHPEIAMLYTEMSGFDDNGFYQRYHLKKYHDSAYRNPGVTYERMFSRSVRLGDMDVVPERLRQEDPGVLDRRAYFGNIFDWYLTNLVLFTNSMMLRRDVVPLVGERNVRVKYWEEMEYTLRITRNHAVGFVDVPTYKLRYHEGQISTTARAHDGRYVWLRKQQILLRIIKKHALADQNYYRQHRQRIDAHLAHLHRAVAVPLLMSDPPNVRRAQRYVRAARRYLGRARKLGHPEHALWLMTFAPRPVRRLGVGLVEAYRKMRRRRGVLADTAHLPA
jgi:glycosyltransferase involved in cell wall biosynthesis